MNPRARGAERAALLLAAALAAACSEGYPSSDAAPDSPFEMSQTQRLAALNALGGQADESRRWRYALEQGCVLAVRHREGWLRRSSVLVRLDEVSVETQPRPDGQGPGVQLVASGRDAAPVTLLLSENPRPAQQASLLLKLLKRDCGADALV